MMKPEFSGVQVISSRFSFLVAAFMLSHLAPAAVAAQEDRISPSGWQQIQSLLDEKASWSPTERKLDSALLLTCPVEQEAEREEVSEGVAEAGGVLTPVETGRHPRWMKLDPDAIFPPPPADWITPVAVPMVLRSPLVSYRPVAPRPGDDQWRAFDLPKPRLRTSDATVMDNGVLAGSTAVPDAPAPKPLAPALTSSFDTTTLVTNIINTGFIFIPADPIGAAGPNHLVNVVNVTLRIHDKAGTILEDTSLASFFSPLSPLTFTFDPKVIYDQHAGRFVVLALEQTDDGAGGNPETSRLFVAVSDDNDPVGTWFEAAIATKINIGGTDHWADFPGLAVDEEAIYVTANMFKFSAAGGSFGGVRLFVIEKGLGGGGFYDGGVLSGSILDPYVGGGVQVTTQPAHIFGTAPAAVGTFLVSYSGLTNGLTEAVQVVRIDNPLGSPTFTQQFVAVGNLEDLVGTLPLAPQAGTSLDVETNDRRALNAVWFEDSLWMTATIDPKSGDPDAGEATAHWWQLDTSSLGALSLAQQGSVLGDDIATDTFTFFPSIAVNGAGQMALGFSGSASSIFPGSYYTTRNPGDATGSTSGSATLRAGLDFYERPLCGTENRWGDYSGVAVDPVDGCFWVYNKHALTRGTGIDCNLDMVVDEDGVWGTAFGKVCPAGSCPPQMVLADTTLAGSQVRSAASSIRTASAVTIAAGADVTFRAGERIVLESGFSVESGASFTAQTGVGCP